ncbi:hypothetical protein PG985_007946 [Apiospora marii]|uniref:uncharacterized protein n=1 Tax=Apiospora marii TaxID=335849 RepID=UPI00312FFDEF
MGFQELPHELLARVADGLTSQKDLTSFGLVSKRFHAAGLPALYRSITLTDYVAKEIDTAREKGNLCHTRSLASKAGLGNGCFHVALPFNKNKAKALEDGVAGNVLPIIAACPDGKLLEFTWDSMACVPATILGKEGHLNTHQKSLESIRLFTDPRCNRTKHGATFDGLDLQAFANLKQLSWAGVIGDDVYSLSDALAGVAPQMEMLDLDFTYYNLPRAPTNPGLSQDDSDDESQYHSLLSKLFRLQRPVPLSLPALRDLRLCEVDFQAPRDVQGLLASVDLARLERLELRSCPNSDLLLARLAASSSSSSPRRLANLRSFTLQMHDVALSTCVVPFLQSFAGLRDLSLAMPRTGDATAQIWRAAAAHHRQSLRRLVYHQRSKDGEVGEAPGRWKPWDQPDLCLRRSDLGKESGGNPLGRLDLQSLGLGCSPKWMVSLCFPGKRIVASYCKKSSLQLLHMRRSGPEFARMAQIWKDACSDKKGSPSERQEQMPLDLCGSESDWEFDDEQSDESSGSEGSMQASLTMEKGRAGLLLRQILSLL